MSFTTIAWISRCRQFKEFFVGADYEVATGIGFRLKANVVPKATGKKTRGFRIVQYGNGYAENQVFQAAVIDDVGLGAIRAALEQLRKKLNRGGIEFYDPATDCIDDYIVGGGFFW